MDITIKKKKWAEDWLGIPYESSGRSLKGLDCWGLVYCLYKNLLGIELPKIDKEYINGLNTSEVAPIFKDYESLFLETELFEKVKKPKTFDLILFRRSGHVSHVAIYLNGYNFLHAENKSGSCIENLKHRYWINRITGYYRYAG